MNPICLSDVAAAASGTLIWGDPGDRVTNVVIDSREAGEGSLFVPLIGERVDAHRFIPQVLDAGAACVFSSDNSVKGQRGACILVDDTLLALQRLAAWYRSQFDIPVVGITGSVGKTTTKEMIGAVLERKYRTVKTRKNLNSQIGLPLMMFELESDTEIAVFEMGISLPGEMDRLAEIARPSVAVMTNIGVSHIGNLGSRENICREKGKIISYMSNGPLYVCGNGDLRELSARCIPYGQSRGEIETLYYGTEAEHSFRGDHIEAEGDGQRFVYHSPRGQEEVHLSVMGTHNVNNAIVALALAEQFEVPLDQAGEALSAYRPMDMRGVVKQIHGAHVIDDTYNASPDSINSNLDALFDYEEAGRKMAVLADVLELGEQSAELHRSIGEHIVEHDREGHCLDLLVTVGRESAHISNYVRENSDIPVMHFAEKQDAAEEVRQRMQPGDWILVKGSRGMQMDKVVEQLTKE